MKPYETLFFTEPGIENEALDALIGKVENAITKNGGQVEKIDKWGRYRVAPGVGLRFSIPMLGPAPLALDFAFPVSKDPRDVTEVFSFSMSGSR